MRLAALLLILVTFGPAFAQTLDVCVTTPQGVETCTNLPQERAAEYNTFCQTVVLDKVNALRAAKDPPQDPLVSLTPDNCLVKVFIYELVKNSQRDASLQETATARAAAIAARQAIEDAHPEMTDP